MFTAIKNKKTYDIIEIKRWVSTLSEEKNGDGEAQAAIICRGLFFVYLYGILESVCHEVIRTTVNILNSRNIHIQECSYDFLSVALSCEYDALEQVGRNTKWEKRWNVSKRFKENKVLQIPQEIFPTDGCNIQYRQLESLTKSFGVKSNVLPRPEIGGYVNEIVRNRNLIAHGNNLPNEVGRSYTNKYLIIRISIVDEVCDHIIESYEKYLEEEDYKKDIIART